MVSKTGFLLKQVSQNFRLQLDSRGHRKAKQRAKLGPKGVQNTKSHYEAKQDFKMRPEFIVE